MEKHLIIDQYLQNGKELIVVDGKIPRKNWRTIIYSRYELINHQGNIAWRLGEKDLVIDIDPRNNGEQSFEKLKEDLNLNFDYTVKSPRGYHIYLKIPDNFNEKLKKTLKNYEGIDFLKFGNLCHIVGSKSEYGEYNWCNLFDEFEQSEAPYNLLQLLSYDENLSYGQSNLSFDELVENNANWSKEKVVELLQKLDPSMKYPNWVKVGMALHNWHVIDGLGVWEEWSKKGNNYTVGCTSSAWQYFKSDAGITLGTLAYMVKDNIFDEKNLKVELWLEKIKNASEKELQLSIIPALTKEKLSTITGEKLAVAIKNRYKLLTGASIPINNIREMIFQSKVVNGEIVDKGEKPKWACDWVYVNSHSAFANLKNLKILKAEAFNILNGVNVPVGINGSKQSATRFVADNGFVDSVDIIAYLPQCKETIVQGNNSTMLNSFDHNSLPSVAREYSEQGLQAIELVKKHIKFICGTDKNSDVFTQWLAHQVQFIGKQILWSPIIQSIQGTGKSFFGELLRCCLGDKNVGTVNPTQIVSEFNGWATGVCVNVLEEMRVKGHNRHEAVNSLKPLITDRLIQINEKGVKPYMTYNTTNYICFTNFKDAIPLDIDDRRWWIIFVDVNSLEEMSAKLGEDIKVYFPKLFNAVRTYGHEIKKWLLEYHITDEFLNTKQAPMTEEKRIMIATEENGIEGLAELREMIERGGRYYNSNYISSSDLFADFMFEHEEFNIQTSKKGLMLKKLGYAVYPKRLKIGGRLKTIWSKSSKIDDLKSIFD